MKYLAIIIGVLFSFSSFTQADSVKNYYKKIVFGNEFDLTDTTGEYRWKKDVKIFLMGEKSPELMNELFCFSHFRSFLFSFSSLELFCCSSIL